MTLTLLLLRTKAPGRRHRVDGSINDPKIHLHVTPEHLQQRPLKMLLFLFYNPAPLPGGSANPPQLC